MKKLIKFNTFLASHWRSAFSFDFISVFHEESLRSGYWIRTIVLNGDSTRVIDPASRTKASSIWCFLYGRRAHVAFERWRRSDSEFSVTFDILQSKKEKKRLNFVISEKPRFSCVIIYQLNGLQIICLCDKTFSYSNECRTPIFLSDFQLCF